MGSTVTCPHCGAENPRSLLVTMCHQCKRDMARPPAEPRAPPPVAAAAPATTPPPAPSAGAPAAAPRPAAEALPPRAGAPVAPNVCPRCNFVNLQAADRCVRCRTPLGGQPAPDAQVRRCPRCGHLQPDGRRSCEHCGLHFVGAQYAGSDALHPVPTARVPRSREEHASATGCGIALFGILAFLLGMWVLLAATR